LIPYSFRYPMVKPLINQPNKALINSCIVSSTSMLPWLVLTGNYEKQLAKILDKL